MQEGVKAEVLLDSEMTELVISSEFVRKQEFKLKKIEILIYINKKYGQFLQQGEVY